MRIKFKRINGEWRAGYYKEMDGVSSLLYSVGTKSIFTCIFRMIINFKSAYQRNMWMGKRTF